MKSPCNNVCSVDPHSGLCKGCQRTLEEIGGWAAMSDAERERIMAELPARRKLPQVHDVTWYFDFVSPFSHIGLYRLKDLPPNVRVTFRPVLFAGLLKHWGQKGPAEIPAKRRWTYRWCAWWAAELGVPFRFPASHPFNPLHHLRLCIAAGPSYEVAKVIFDSLWTSGAEADDPQRFSSLCKDLGIDPGALSAPEIKDALRRNTEEAAARGVFGVPSFEAQGEVFWGADAMEFFGDFLRDRRLFEDPEMQRVDRLPAGAARRG
ncbi:MAG TPA: DsbA family protein [Burkholderiales bacterium]|nr:DsbA family protein [Burkholderiales bacterium]